MTTPTTIRRCMSIMTIPMIITGRNRAAANTVMKMATSMAQGNINMGIPHTMMTAS